MIKRTILFLQFILLISFSFSQDVFLSLDGSNLNYESSADIAGFQIFHNGCVDDATGGDAAANGFTISASSTVVLAFSFSGSVVPAGGGTLIILHGDVTADCLENFIFSDESGFALEWEFTEDSSDDGGDGEAVCPEGTDVCLSLDGNNLGYESSADIAGFQFDHDGCLTSPYASGGDAEAAGFTISGSASTVLAFSFSGAVVPAGSGTLVELEGAPTEECLSDFIFSDASGGSLVANFSIEAVNGCTDDTACNYDSEANTDDGSCVYAEENFDCDGNCLTDTDCAGECGGDALEDCAGTCDGNAEVDECGECGGDGSTCEYGCEEGVEVCLTIAAENLNYSSSADIAGFQFNHDGCATGASGGDAAANGFTISASSTVVLAFSFTGSVIPAGVGTLLDLGSPDCSEGSLSEFVFSDASGGPLLVGFPILIVEGCTDAEACNYDPDANTDDGSCIDAEENYDCDGNCLVTEDCSGECGGSAELDECGECDGDGSLCSVVLEFGAIDVGAGTMEIVMTNSIPVGGFQFVVSGVDIESASGGAAEDAGFTVSNSSSVVLGFSFTGSTIDPGSGVLTTLSFSQVEEGGCISDAVISDAIGGGLNPVYGDCVEFDSGPETIDYCLDLHFGANLVSFYALPADLSIGNMMSSLDGIVTGVIGEGVAASPNPTLGWVGSLSEVDPTSGYWVKVSESSSLCLTEAARLNASEITYDLHFGANLISFPNEYPVDLAAAIPDDVEDSFTGIIGEGVAASPNPVLGWVGSLSAFEGGNGYWAKVDAGIVFNFEVDQTSSRIKPDHTANNFNFTQSTEQAFYFIENIVFEDGTSIESGDVVLAYNDNILVGAREWAGAFTDIPAMGSDGSFTTIGYCDSESSPEFKVIKSSTGVEYDLSIDAPKWSSNGVYQLGVVTVLGDVNPDYYTISGAYPNPFNPSTNIMVDISGSGHATVSIYNTNGQEVSNLWSGVLSEGSHSFLWDGSNQASGIYFARLNINGAVSTSKIMLVK